MPYGTLSFKNINTKNNDLTLYVNNNKLYFRNENVITSNNLNNYISNGLKIIDGKISTTNSNLFNIPCSLPTYKINIKDNKFNKAILAYQNLISKFENYIVLNDIIINKIAIIQSNLIKTNNIINIINKTNNKNDNVFINIDNNKIKKQNISNISFNENDIIEIEIKNDNEYVEAHELLIILSGYYKDINNNKNEIYERIINLEKKINY